MNLLEVSDLQSGYGKLPVLHGVSLRVEQDEIVAIVGPNGAGKTTLLKTIFRLLPIQRGSIVLDGRDLRDVPPTRLAELGAALVPQGGNTFPDLSVEDNLKVALAGRARSRGGSGVRRMLDRFPVLEARRRQRARTLSGGERQMLALASAMVTAPRFLALDEPTTGLAPTVVGALVEQILEFREGGTTVLWVVEENPLQILRYVDRVYLVRSGVCEQELAADDLLRDQTLQSLFFGTTTDTQAERREPSVSPSTDAR